MDANNYNSSRMTTPLQMFDPDSALKLSESRDVIENIFLDHCGLHRQQNGSQVMIIRVSSPTFTYEFAKALASRMYLEVNRLTARTSFDTEKLSNFSSLQSDTMARWFASEGVYSLISSEAWDRIQELSKLDPSTIVEDKNGNLVGQSKWENRYGIKWSYNDPVNDDMLKIVKKEFDLDNESFGQSSILSTLFWSVRIFIEGGLNRSKEGLTLDHEKMIHKESVVMNGSQSSNSNEGLMERIKSKLGGLL